MTGNESSVRNSANRTRGPITLPEMVENAENIKKTVEAPLITDVNNRYGNTVNVTRTPKQFTKTSVARRGFVEGKRVIGWKEAILDYMGVTSTCLPTTTRQNTDRADGMPQ